MLCDTALEHISGHLDGQNNAQEEAELQAHLSECASCRALMESMTRLELYTRRLQAEPPARLKQGVMAAIAAETATPAATARSARPRRGWIASVCALGAVAAALALVVGTGALRLPKLTDNLQAVPEVREEAAGEDAVVAEEAEEQPAVTTPTQAELPTDVAPEGASETPAEYLQQPALGLQNEMQTYDGAEGVTEEEFALPFVFSGGTSPASAAEILNKLHTDNTSGNGILRHAEGNANRRFDPALSRWYLFSEETEAPVLVLEGFDAHFVRHLEEFSPELAVLLADAVQKPLDEDAPEQILLLDTDRAFALAEWLELMLPAEDEDAQAEEEDAQTEDEDAQVEEEAAEASSAETDTKLPTCADYIEAYDPDGQCLADRLELPEAEGLSVWRELFERLFGEECRWTMLYPTQDYEPQADGPFYLILLPASESAEPTP